MMVSVLFIIVFLQSLLADRMVLHAAPDEAPILRVTFFAGWRAVCGPSKNSPPHGYASKGEKNIVGRGWCPW